MASPQPQQQTLALVWESEMVAKGGGRVELVARKPLSVMTRRQAAKVLGVSEWTVSDLFRLGFLKGYKPGSRRVRSDGKASNASLRLDSESVLSYKAARQAGQGLF